MVVGGLKRKEKKNRYKKTTERTKRDRTYFLVFTLAERFGLKRLFGKPRFGAAQTTCISTTKKKRGKIGSKLSLEKNSLKK